MNGGLLEYRRVPALSIPTTAPLSAANGVLTTTFDDEVVLLNLADGVYYGLTDVGARVWHLVGRTTTLESICQTVASEYDVDASRCAKDIHALVQDLLRHRLVDVAAT